MRCCRKGRTRYGPVSAIKAAFTSCTATFRRRPIGRSRPQPASTACPLPAPWPGIIFLPSSSTPRKASPPACNFSPTSCAGVLDLISSTVVLIIPAIDLKDGRCVRLKQGDMSTATVFSDDPVAMAKHWKAQGAKRLHIVDLNGAVAGRPKNEKVIRAMIAAVGDQVAIQLGGGIRDLDAIESYLDAGVTYVIIGTAAVKNPGFLSDACYAFPGHVIAGLDAKDGKVAVEGWSKMTGHDVVDLAKKFEEYGVEAISYTDIGRDGMMSGVNIEATFKLAQALKTPLIASGGLNSIADVQAICVKLVPEGVIGAIAGRALYEGKLDLKAAQAAADK